MRQAAHVREKVKTAIVDQLKKSGGSTSSSERGLAKLIGTSRPTVRRAVNGLVLAGVLAAEATRNGTMLRLVA
jgi:DNA-binding GntR family transcriptional regulator